MSEQVLELYITGNSVRSENAIKSINKICDDATAHKFKLDIIDVLESPEMAENAKILATPTLIKRLPPPVRRLVGDLSDIDKVKQYLDLV